MYVRLAFAVAAHLEPEILIVDEVLAVGDAEFQKKCIQKMQDVAAEGRAVVFVSHNAHFVQRLCTRVLLLESGTVVADGDPADVVTDYFHRIEPDQAEGTSVIPDEVPRNGTGAARLRRVSLLDLQGAPLTAVRFGQRFRVEAEYEVFQEIEEATFEIGLSTVENERIATIQTTDEERPPVHLRPGRCTVTMETGVTLLPGEFYVDVALHPTSGLTADHVERTLRFAALNVAESGGDHYPWQHVRGFVRPSSSWSVSQEPAVPEEPVQTEVT
jgi:lipopolysaccharide transport system ATP-binding protein